MLAGLTERVTTLRSWLLPQSVYLAPGDDALTLLRLHGQGEEPVSEVTVLPLPAGACVDGLPLQKEALGDLLGDWLLEQGLVGGRLEMALPGQACQWRVVEWPGEEPPADGAGSLRTLQPDLRLPYDLDEAFLAVTPLPGRDPSDPPASLVVSAERYLVEAWLEVAVAADLQVHRLEAPQVCEWRALTAVASEGPMPDAEGLLAVLLPEDPGCRLLLLQDGTPEFERRFSGSECRDRQLFHDELVRTVRFLRRRRDLPADTSWCLVGRMAEDAPLEAELRARDPDWSVWSWNAAQDWPTDLESDGSARAVPLLRLAGLIQMELAS